jgi:hypothetical protein
MPFLKRHRQSARIASATHISASPEEGVERAEILAEPYSLSDGTSRRSLRCGLRLLPLVPLQDPPMGSGPSGSSSLDPERGGRSAARRHERGRAACLVAFRHPRWTALLRWFSRRSARSAPSLGPPRRCSGRDLPSHDRQRLPVGSEEPRLARSTGRLARLRSRPWSTVTTQVTNLTPAPVSHARTRVHVTSMTLGSWSTPRRRVRGAEDYRLPSTRADFTCARFESQIAAGVGGSMSSHISAKLLASWSIRDGRARNHQ